VIPNSTEWHHKHITEWIASICKVKLAFWDLKVMNTCIMKYPSIRCTSLPATEDVGKMHVECCGSQDILGDATFAVAIAGPGRGWRVSTNMSAINCSKGILEEWGQEGL